jgi:hypothetical protein
MPRKQSSEKDLVMSSHTAAVPARRKSASTTRKERTVSKVESPVVSSAPAKSESAAVAGSSEPTYQEIAQLAYHRWVARGCPGGSAEADWLEAEQELRARA